MNTNTKLLRVHSPVIAFWLCCAIVIFLYTTGYWLTRQNWSEQNLPPTFRRPAPIHPVEPPRNLSARIANKNTTADSTGSPPPTQLQTSTSTVPPSSTARAQVFLQVQLPNTTLQFTDVRVRFALEDQHLGNTYQGQKCSEEFGMEMIEKWKTTKIDVCSGYSGQSHITCSHRAPFDISRHLCVATNAMVRMYPPFYQGVAKTVIWNLGSNVTKGILEVNCDLDLYNLIPPDWWKSLSLQSFMKNITVNSRMECNHYVNHTVFWMLRYDIRNLFHFMEDVVTTFETFLVLNEDPADIELVIYDSFPDESYQFFNLWRRMFGHGIRIVHENPYPVGTCFQKSIFSMYAERSHFSNGQGVKGFVSCQSPILRTMLAWIKSMYGVPPEQRDHNTPSSQPQQILWISRRNYNNRTITRVIPNEAEILHYISSRLPAHWNITAFSPELIPTLEQQIQLVSTARILIGVHGAGLANLMFMPNDASSHVIEIFHSDRSSLNRHYINICKWLGITHHGTGYFSSEVSPLAVWTIIQNILRQEQEH